VFVKKEDEGRNERKLKRSGFSQIGATGSKQRLSASFLLLLLLFLLEVVVALLATFLKFSIATLRRLSPLVVSEKEQQSLLLLAKKIVLFCKRLTSQVQVMLLLQWGQFFYLATVAVLLNER